MPVANCGNCGKATNSTTSDYWDQETGHEKVTRCYAAMVKGAWVKGCSYDKTEPHLKRFVDELISKDDTPEDKD